MQYDPIKNIFGKMVSKNILLRKIFYYFLDFIFLRTWYVKREIKNLFKKDVELSILDAGMGFGQYTYFLSRYFKKSKIKAVDIKKEQIIDCDYFFKKLNKKNVSIEYADLTQIKYEDEFNFILSVDVMEHIKEDQKVFNNFYRALKQDGYLLVNTPSNFGGSNVHSEDDKSFIEEHARNGYSKEEIESKLKHAGFEIKDFKYSYGKYGRIYWLIGMKYPISLIGITKIFIFLLPFYYIITIIPLVILMGFDYTSKNKYGSGILITAKK